MECCNIRLIVVAPLTILPISAKKTQKERESQSVFRQQGHSALALWIDGQPSLIHLVEVVVWRASEALTIRVSIVVEFTSPIMYSYAQ